MFTRRYPMELLRKLPDHGYPIEYLLSRIRGRRARLIRDWKPLLFDPALYESPPTVRAADAAWRNLMTEYQWVYSQMNQGLRDIFFSFFLYTELRTILICLRHLVDKKTGAIDELLDRSLLSDEVKKVLLFSPDLPAAMSGIERLFSSFSDRFPGFGEVLESGGLRVVEQRLIGTYLSVTVDSDLPPLLKRFFSRIIDARNIMGLYKYLRLGFKVRPEFIAGGAISEIRLSTIVKKDDLPGIALLVREMSGIAVERPDPASIELALYRGMTRWLRREGRDPFGIAPLLDYLWRCSIEAMNLSVLHHTKDLEREAVAAELVQ
jgi:hypothetical protein